MTALPLLLVLTAAFAHAAWNLASKRAGASGIRFVWLACLGGSLLLTPFAVTALAAQRAELMPWLACGAVSGLVHTAYFSTLQRGYAHGDISVVYPLARGTGPMLSVVFAMLLLHERPGWLGMAGAAAVVAGVVVIALSARVGATPPDGLRRPLSGAVFGLVTGVLIATYTLWDAHAVTAVGVAPLTMMWMSSTGQVVLLAPLVLRDPARLESVWRRYRREVVTVAVLSPLAYILVLYAVQRAPVSLVAPIREMSVVIVSLAGSLLFAEPAFRRRLVGAVVVLLGVTLLALS
ncbi:EamA family transporter [Microlunatus panaciterrae]|uniref:Drug/metabolite transporter (DMT)-like permease n=1 Tax=Microlunatus panaciterrae TaxID=400768 RepID=A0ABS2RHG6_9ACTN|nr:EamA family transporter [Microlunatus panaciterrae]MBM7797977.1 drug/metabolite transporter (DMT)-like permease [Microlunatus panaciterrae]